MKRKLYFILLISLFVFSGKVMAAPNITTIEQSNPSDIGKDLYNVVVDNASDATYVVAELTSGTPLNGTSVITVPWRYTGQNSQYISLYNGTWSVRVKSNSGDSNRMLVNVSDSCTNESFTNQTGDGYYQSCIITDGYNARNKTDGGVNRITCATGYNMSFINTVTNSDCGKRVQIYGLQTRYCREVREYHCVKSDSSSGGGSSDGGGSSSSSDSGSVASGNSKLSALSVTGVSINPSFSPSTYNYNATTSASSVTINATLQNSGAIFVDNYGPRSVNLKYGTNNIQIKTKDGNTTNTYVINIKREDGRNSDNTLSSLSVSEGDFSPTFNSLTNSYKVIIGNDVKSLDINASLNNTSSSFVDGYGPRHIDIISGYSKVSVKVKSESGNVRTYYLTIARSGDEEDSTSSSALLTSLSLSSGKIDFDPNIFDYNVSVGYDVNYIDVDAQACEKCSVEVTGDQDLKLDETNELKIKVTDENGNSNTYVIYVNRKAEDLAVSSNNLLSDLKVDGYKLKFDAKKTEYTLKINEGVSILNILATASDEKSTVSIEGNENLKNGSKIKIKVTAEDGSVKEYVINIRVGNQGGNIFLTIIVVILIILVLAYLVLRAMGYKIWFNFDAVKEKLFRRKK